MLLAQMWKIAWLHVSHNSRFWYIGEEIIDGILNRIVPSLAQSTAEGRSKWKKRNWHPDISIIIAASVVETVK